MSEQPVYELVMRNFLIDIVEPVDQEEYEGAKVRLVTYSVLGTSAENALHRFFDEEAGIRVYEGEPVDCITVGIEVGNTPLEGTT